jgi:hypothetical protein
VPRSRRWDFLYDREKQPIRTYLLAELARMLAAEIEEARPPDARLRAALEAARLDLARDWDGVERVVSALPEDERAAARGLARELVEACLDLKERAEGARLGRGDLADALRLLEGRLFRVIG